MGGDTVALGAPIPPGRIGRFNVTAYLIEGAPTGFFEGGRDVRVRVTRSGDAASIRLAYDTAISFDSLVAAFRDSLGAPGGGGQRPGTTNVRWENRITRVWLTPTTSEFQVYLTDPRLNGTVPAEHRGTGRADTASGLPR